MKVNINIAKAKMLAISSGIICILTSAPYALSKAGYKWFDESTVQGNPFTEWIYYVGQSFAGILVYWALKVTLYSDRWTRYAMDLFMDLALIDFIHCTFFSFDKYWNTQTIYIGCSFALLIIKLYLNRFHWFRRQNFI